MVDQEYEKSLRRNLCLMPAFNTLIIGLLLISSVNERSLHFHQNTPKGEMGIPLITITFLSVLLFGEWYSKLLFIIIGTIRTALGILSLVLFIPALYGFGGKLALFLFMLPFTLIAPLLIYWRCMKKRKKEELQEFKRKCEEEVGKEAEI